MATDSDDVSITSSTPAQQCIFWTLTISFMIKLGCFVVLTVIINNNAWILIEPTNFDYAFIRGISFDDCAYPVLRQENIECIKWSLWNQTEWVQFWSKHGVNTYNVREPSAWYSNTYYICLLLLVWYLTDMGSMLVMCCRQKQTTDRVEYQKQISFLSSLFIIITYITIHLGLSNGREVNFVQVQFPADSRLGLGATLFVGTFIAYIVAILVQYAYHIYNCRDSLPKPSSLLQRFNLDRFFNFFQTTEGHQHQTTTSRFSRARNGEAEQRGEVELSPLRNL